MNEIIAWLVEQFVLFSERDDSSMETHEMNTVIALLDIVSLISVERLKIEEDTNQLIRLTSS